MNLEHFTTQMSNNTDAIRSLVQDVTQEQARWKPNPDSWSILEVINHLYDEEQEDFRPRLDLLLHQPGQAWPVIDPAGWVIERQYNQRDIETSLHNFLKARQESISWLKSLSSPDWQSAYEHPSIGHISAGDIFASWLAHDFLHMRQLAELHWTYVSFLARPYAVDYAGPW